jgi:hypothetical protein
MDRKKERERGTGREERERDRERQRERERERGSERERGREGERERENIVLFPFSVTEWWLQWMVHFPLPLKEPPLGCQNRERQRG